MAHATSLDRKRPELFAALWTCEACQGLKPAYTSKRQRQEHAWFVQRLAGLKQEELEVSAMALMAGYTPIATAFMACLVPIFEPLGLQNARGDTLLGFPYTLQVKSPISLASLAVAESKAVLQSPL